MFTGIIEEVGEVVEARVGLLRVRVSRIHDGTKLGDSIAVDGVDLTVAEMKGTELSFNVMAETYRVTTLGRLGTRSRVNLERAMRAEDRFGGHVVRGVVEGTGRIEARRNDGDSLIMTCSAPGHLIQSMIERGPVCVDGVSLTVIAKTDLTFLVSLVAFTQAHTTLLERKVGDPVNIETDIMMRYVSQALRARGLRPAAQQS
jgi:riboflavin synthase